MELRQIEHFVAVADEMSFTRAAARAHIVQSALSTSIAKLERELGVTLFDRSRQQIALTAAGDAFRIHAGHVMQTTRTAAESMAPYRGTLSGTIEFGSLISYGGIDVPKILGDFHRLHPFVRLRLRLSQSGASAYLAALVDGSLDVALVSAPLRFPPQLQMRLLFEERMVFVCPPDHPLAARAELPLSDLAGEELIGFPPEFGLRRLMDDAFHAAGCSPTTQYEAPAGFAAIAELVVNGLGTAFMPQSEARRHPTLSAVALAEPVIWQVYLASPSIDRMTLATTELVKMLLAAAEN